MAEFSTGEGKGELVGGEKLNTYLAALAQKVSAPGFLKVGFLENATYPDGTSVPMVGAIQNFGAPKAGIPPRPFFSHMIARHKDEWGPELAEILKAKNFDAAAALDVLGVRMGDELRQSIRDTNSPPLKPATIRRKGFDKPLIDSSVMINSVDHEVT